MEFAAFGEPASIAPIDADPPALIKVSPVHKEDF